MRIFHCLLFIGLLANSAWAEPEPRPNSLAFNWMGIDAVQRAGWTGAGVAVAVIDSGFRLSHETLRGKVQAVATYRDDNADYVLDTEEKHVGAAAEMTAAHGTAVASVLSAVAPGAGLWLKASGDENPYTRDLVIASLDALLNEQIEIINHSNDLFANGLIYRSADDDETGLLPALAQSQAVVSAAAGNFGLDLSEALDGAQAQVPGLSSFFDKSEEAEHVLLVGVYDENERDLALLSNRPGHRQGLQARFLTVVGAELLSASSGADDAYREVAGTSFAAPLLSGALAVLKEVNPYLSTVEAAELLLDSAHRPAELGYGASCMVETDLGVFSSDCGAMRFGAGIMDLATAVEQAGGEVSPITPYFDSISGMLHIPVLEADKGLYRVSLSFVGVDARYTPGYLFELAEVSPVFGTPSATYAMPTGMVSLPRVLVEDAFYSAELSTLPDSAGSLFAVNFFEALLKGAYSK